MRTKLLGIAAIIGSTLIIASHAHGAISAFSDRPTFLAATSSTTNIDFEGLAAPGSYVDYGLSGLTLSGATFTGSDSYLYVVDPAFTPAYYDWGSGATLLGNHDGTISVTLPAGVTAVGSDIMSILNYAAVFTVTLSDGSMYTASSSAYPTRAFIGFTSSSSSITSISFQATGGYGEQDNFVFGAAAVGDVPEPTSLVVWSLIAATFGGARWWRRRKSA